MQKNNSEQYVLQGVLNLEVPIAGMDKVLPMVCSKCGSMIGKNHKINYCPFCGSKIHVYEECEAYRKAVVDYEKVEKLPFV